MIKTTLPIVEKTIDEQSEKLVVVEKTIDVIVDTSLFAEERWETNFPYNAKNETLFAYIERVQTAGKIDDKAHIMANLKALFCFLDGEKISDFKSFCQLFDIADTAYFNKLVSKIKFVFELAINGSATSQKN